MNKRVVEITGLPCSGKSFVCDLLDGFLNKKQPSLIKNIFFEIKYILRGLYFLKSSILHSFLILCLHEKTPLRYRLKIFRNIVKKFGIYNSFRNSETEGYIDEGISHIPFNFLDANTSEIVNILRPYLALTNVKYIRSDNDIRIRERLLRRGHDRLTFLNVDELIRLNRNVEIVLLTAYPNVCLTFEVIEND